MKIIKRSLVAAAFLATLSTQGMAVVYPSAPAPMDVVTGKKTTLGYLTVNPFGSAPLTALIDLKGNSITGVTVKVHGKGKDGVAIEYPVGKSQLLTYDGIPIFGLYQNHKNKITVSFKNLKDNKKYTHTYEVFTSPIENKYIDSRNISALPTVEVVKVDKRFKDKLMFTNSLDMGSDAVPLAWAGKLNNEKLSFTDTPPTTGAMGFTSPPVNYVVDTQGEIRWWLNQDALFDSNDLDVDNMGNVMGIHETKDGTFTYSMGVSYGEFDLMGRVISKNRLPRGYVDVSHEIIEMPNGNYLIRAAKANYVRKNGDTVHTVRDHVIEVTKSGRLVEVWDFNKILDPLRDVLLLGLDQGAVCLNVDTSKTGQTAEALEPDAPYGDITGVGAGRNWIHINSIAYDPKDDAIIISPRHQATAVKVGRDKEIDWILAPKVGWNKELSKKLLTPVDAKGKKITCDDMGVCEDENFDFSYTQHTAWLSPNGTLTVFDNGDARWNEQPAISEDKWSRFVEYKINEKDMTVQQIWEYGKERGYEWYSPITSNVELIVDDGKPYMYGFGGSAGLFNPKEPTKGIHNIIDYKTKDVLLEVVSNSMKPSTAHYRGLLIEPDRVFGK